MRYVVAGSLGNISKPLSEKLVAAGHDVTIISSHQDKAKAIETLGATAAIGSVEDLQFLKQTFKGAGAVYTMVPPKWDAQNWKEWIGNIGQNYAATIKDAGVKFVVTHDSR